MRGSNAPSIRVLHVPFNTPYARKTIPSGVSLANGMSNVPELATVEWAASLNNLHQYDICHVHFFERTSAPMLSDCLRRCKEHDKRIVATLHDTFPIHGCDPHEYAKKIQILVEEADVVVALTAGSAKEIQSHYGTPRSMVRIPLGCVVSPTDPNWGSGAYLQTPVRFAAFGSMRRNRRIDLLVRAFENLQNDIDSRLDLLLRPIGTTTKRDLEIVRGYESSRVSLRIQSIISDEEVAEFVAGCSILVLPYEWVCHSGQLELAFDMGVGVVAPNAGYLREQWLLSKRFVPRPTFFSWSTLRTAEERIGVLASGLRHAFEGVQSPRLDHCEDGGEFREHRRREFATFLGTYGQIYRGLVGRTSC